jgi:CelD/BcsL family acetyltransferase involved in cellulose biosynthesis
MMTKTEITLNNKNFIITISQNFEDCEVSWRNFEDHSYHTPYQTYDFQQGWWHHIGQKHNITPIIITVEYDKKAVMLWPLGLNKKWFINEIQFLGGKHSNYNMPLIDKDFYHHTDNPSELINLVFKQMTKQFSIDCIELKNQPHQWESMTNPLSFLPHLPSPSHSYKFKLNSDFKALQNAKRSTQSQRTLRRKIRRLEDEGDLVFEKVTTKEKLNQLLPVFFKHKKARFDTMGIRDVFDEAGARDFIVDLSHRSLKAKHPALIWHQLCLNEEILASYAGGVALKRYSCSLNSLCDNDKARYSPTDILLQNVIEELCQKGFETMDLGIGKARYKDSWCEQDPLFDSLISTSWKGKLCTMMLMRYSQFKGLIKGNKALWKFAKFLRKTLFSKR